MAIDPAHVQQLLELLRQRYPDWTGFDHPAYLKDERNYKLEAVNKAHELLAEALLRGLLEQGDTAEFIRRLETVGRSLNLLYNSRPTSGDMSILYQRELPHPEFCHAMVDLLYGPGDSPERLGRYIEFLSQHDLPSKWPFPTFFLFICHPESDIFIKPSITQWLLDMLGETELYNHKPTKEVYARMRSICAELLEAFRPNGAQDMIDVQSVVWICARTDQGIMELGESDGEAARFYKIAPGSDAWNWDACRDGGFITMGWEDLGDISGLSWEKFKQLRDEKVAANEGWNKRGANQVWTFAHLRPGDRIVANHGMGEVLGIGTVAGPYTYVQGVKHGHRLPVQWDDLTRRRVNEPGWRSTLVPLDEDKFFKLCNAPIIDDVSPVPEPTGYWVFQGSPNIYRVVDALKAGVISSWSVQNHKTKIKPDDKFILWLTGKESGCYALGTVTTPVRRCKENPEELPYYVTPTEAQEGDHCGVRFDLVLADTPILKDKVQANPRLANLKAGLQGTNFAATKEQFEELLRMAEERPDPPPFPPPPPIYSLESMAAETFMAVETLAGWVRAVDSKGQAIFYGPPGTGKTFIAQRLARHLAGGGDGLIELVQFHPEYAYQDFMQGIRPKVREGGELGYEMVAGVFMRFCAEAERREGTCVLIIDEINRANLARVFGELMYLLEYRGERVRLPGGEPFRIPKNVRIIGTMNTADRSIALVDYALRRRFRFLRLAPDFGVLRGFFAGDSFRPEGLIGVLSEINTLISDPHYAVGISFFLRQKLAGELEEIWTQEILPYLEEFFFDNPAKAERFAWAKIKDRVLPHD